MGASDSFVCSIGACLIQDLSSWPSKDEACPSGAALCINNAGKTASPALTTTSPPDEVKVTTTARRRRPTDPDYVILHINCFKEPTDRQFFVHGEEKTQRYFCDSRTVAAICFLERCRGSCRFDCHASSRLCEWLDAVVTERSAAGAAMSTRSPLFASYKQNKPRPIRSPARLMAGQSPIVVAPRPRHLECWQLGQRFQRPLIAPTLIKGGPPGRA